MVQGAPQVAGRFPEELRMYKAPPPEISSEQFYETDAARGFARGFSIQTVGPLPIGWAEHVLADGHWGQALREYMRDYNHWYDARRALRAAAAAGEPRHAGRRDRRQRHAGRPHGLHASATTTAPTSPSASSVLRRDLGGRRRPGHADDRPLRPPGRRLPDGRLARRAASSTPTTAPGTCRTCSSPTAA